MKIFEGKNKNFIERLIYMRNLVYIVLLIFYSYLIFIFKPLNDYKYLLIILLSLILLIIYYTKSRTIIKKLIFEDNNDLILEGETQNNSWTKSINIKETKISIISKGSKVGICGALFYLNFKFKNENYKLNYFQNFSDDEIIKIFEEFKMMKDEKIIIDEKLVLNRIQEKINKC